MTTSTILTTEEYHKMLATKKKRNKYGVAPKGERTVNGKTYASKAEAQYAAGLSLALAAGTIVEFIEQPRLWLGVRENVYVPDFLIIMKNEAYYVDVKGVETPSFRRIKKLWAAYGRLPLHVVKLNGTRFLTTEVIAPK